MLSRNTTLQGPMAALRESEINLLEDIATELAEYGEETEADRKRLSEVAQDLRDMFFLVVIIGEFNAGKSTFVNALIGDEVLPMGITPTTEVIELITYDETPNRKPAWRSEGLREWTHPNTGAPGVAIVDTPGTGSVFQKHEQTAKDFLHRSDLVIFVLSAKRAFAETERIYMEMAKNFGKKMILVVNQADLLQPSELATVRRFIEQQVKQHIDIQPLLFMVSGKEALVAVKAGSPVMDDPGGVGAVRAHLRGVFEETPPAKQKLLAQLDMARTILQRYLDDVTRKADVVSADTARVKEVETELSNQSLGMDTRLTEARAEVDRVFSGIRQRGHTFIESNLSVRKVASTVSREKLQAEFQDVVIGRALRDLNETMSGYVNAVVDNSRLYWRGVIERLNKLQELLEQEFSGLDASAYAEQRESLQDAIAIAEAELRSYSSGRVVDEMHAVFETNAGGFRTGVIAGMGGVIGALAAAALPGPIIGAGATVLAAPLFVVTLPLAIYGGVRSFQSYRNLSRATRGEFDQRVDRLMDAYHTALDEITKKERSRLAKYGTQTLTPIFSRLDVLAERYTNQKNRLETYHQRVQTLYQGIQES